MDDLDTQDGTTKYLGVNPRTLEEWRHRRIGPAYYRVGKAVRYRRTDVDAWLETTRVDASGKAA